MALAWKDIYITPTGRLGGMEMVLLQSGAKNWSDPDVRAKMYAAWTGGAKAFLEYGGYAHELGQAMMDPEFTLSARWRGREVEWSLDDSGEYIIDNTDKYSCNFTSKMAEDFCISKGTAENLDDLALLLGYREYRVVDGQGEKLVEDYVRNWRRAYEDAKVQLEDFQKYMGWASGADAVKYLGRAKGALEKVLGYIERYKAVETRLVRELGISKLDLTVLIEQIQEQLRAARSGSGGGGPAGPARRGSGSGLGG